MVQDLHAPHRIHLPAAPHPSERAHPDHLASAPPPWICIPWVKERLELDDGDFLDLNWLRHPVGHRSGRLVVLSHGLEGSADGLYIRTMTAALHKEGWDVLAWNFRGCSGEPNRLLRSYTAGSPRTYAL